MGELFGFLKYERELPADRAELSRIKDWDEIHELLPVEEQRRQAARCMGCAVPFCHSGITLKGVMTGCPLGNLIPEWNDLLYRGEWDEAAKRLLRTNSFPEFTGRVCPALCEGACTCGLNQPQVTVRQNELSVIEHAFASGLMKPEPPKTRTGKRVAVIGSGPSGLACANRLNRCGHSVTVYERDDRVGGLLMYGIPNMKLDKRIVSRRVEMLEAEGVAFQTGCEIGAGESSSKLLKEYDAVVLCIGSRQPRDLDVPGRQGAGVAFALDYLTASTRHVLDEAVSIPEALDARGKHVVVIGGGDTGTDCVGTAIRQGCKSVCQLEIMPKPPEARAESNPWPEYPKTLKVDYAQREAIALYGSDPREYLVQTSELLLDENGRVRAVRTDSIEWLKGESGRMSPRAVEGTSRERPAELVLIAMGFTGAESGLADSLGVLRDARTNLLADDYQTARAGVFTAGDAHSGQSLVVRAINEGQRAAAACDRYLQNR